MKLRLIKKVKEAKETASFFWQTEKEVRYLPGQYFYFTLPKLDFSDPRGATRHFTLSSSPTEKDTIRCTTRIREESGFKKTLDALPIGSEIEGEGPNGTFILDDNEKGPHIFLAGGIGITPFRSMIKYNIDKNLKIAMHLIYSNSDSDFAFKKDLDGWKNDYIKIEYVDTAKEGRIDEDKLNHFISSTFWVVGPPPFVDAMEDTLGKLGVVSVKIRVEKFTGY